MISSVEIYDPCTRTKPFLLGRRANISPLPSKDSAPVSSRIVLESIDEGTLKPIRDGTTALISPVITDTEGLCVQIIK